MNKSNINKLSAQTEADSNSTAQNEQVSQPNANTNVVGSLFKSREIKFRAWHKEYKKMLVVYVIHQGTYSEGFVKNCQGFVPPNEQYIFKFDEAEWMQYTGLKDNNGKEIYEGDIQDYGNGRIVVVIFKNGCFGLKMPNGDFERTWISPEQFSVIGNIFENPELLQSVA